MKKFLLMAMAALVAMSASAQRFKNLKLEGMRHISTEKVFNNANEAAKMTSEPAKRMQKAPSPEELGGTKYMQVSFEDMTLCSKAVITPEKYTISEEYEDPETGEKQTYTFECNVKLQMNFYDGTKWGDIFLVNAYGYYDQEAATITVPSQYMEDPTAEFGPLLLFTVNEQYVSYDDIIFNVEDNGAIFLNSSESFYVGYVEGEGESSKLYALDRSTQTSIMPINATMQGYESSYRTSNSWTQMQFDIAVDDQETSIGIYGFCGYGAVSIDVNEDGSVSIATGQPLYDLGLDDEEFAILGYGQLKAASIDEKSIYADDERPYIVGEIEGNTITITDPEAESYFLIATNPSEEGRYWIGVFAAMTITLNNGGFIAGVDGPTLEERIKNTKTYNLMGQQVNRDTYKGVMIRDGKKYFKK